MGVGPLGAEARPEAITGIDTVEGRAGFEAASACNGGFEEAEFATGDVKTGCAEEGWRPLVGRFREPGSFGFAGCNEARLDAIFAFEGTGMVVMESNGRVGGGLAGEEPDLRFLRLPPFSVLVSVEASLAPLGPDSGEKRFSERFLFSDGVVEGALATVGSESSCTDATFSLEEVLDVLRGLDIVSGEVSPLEDDSRGFLERTLLRRFLVLVEGVVASGPAPCSPLNGV